VAAAGDDVNLPRTQAGASPQHLIVTLLGDYWMGRTEHLPSAGLVDLAAEFDISATSARAALSRLARRGLLESSKVGRRTYYRLTPRAESILEDGAHRIVNFGITHGPWDESWVVVVFSVPEEQRDIRHVLRTRLRWFGFAPLYDGVWVSPRAGVDEATDLLDQLGVTTSTVFVSRVARVTEGGDPLRAWDLDGLLASYDAFIDEFAPMLDRIHAGDVGSAEALVARTRIMDVWRQFPNLDPGLPEDALPAGWPRAAARQVFARVYDELGPLAEARVQQILAEEDPELARQARHRTTATLDQHGRTRVGAS
jgi:phenylacetic acid degradation operon negative regulatory protein